MSKKFTIKLSSNAELAAKKRSTCAIDGAMKGTTKVQGRKGKKAYNRKNRSWQKEV